VKWGRAGLWRRFCAPLHCLYQAVLHAWRSAVCACLFNVTCPLGCPHTEQWRLGPRVCRPLVRGRPPRGRGILPGKEMVHRGLQLVTAHEGDYRQCAMACFAQQPAIGHAPAGADRGVRPAAAAAAGARGRVPGAALHRGPAAGGECKFTYYSVFRVIVACFGVSLVLHCIVDQRQEVSPLDAIRA